MNNFHINDVFKTFVPNEEQEKRMYARILHPLENHTKRKRQYMPLVIACSFIGAFALFMGLFPFSQKGDDNGIEFAFTGLTITAYAAETSDGSITLGIELFEKFDNVEISVSKGRISLTSASKEPLTQAITIRGNEIFRWEFGSIENAILTFRAFNTIGNVVSSGSLDMSSGEMIITSIKSYPKAE